MKSFKEYLSEETMPQALADKEFVGVESEAVRDNINNLIKGVTAKPFVTPYIALERVRKVLAYFHISLPAHNFMQGDYGYSIFNINQFGAKFGQTNDGQVVVKEDSPYSVYFEYQASDEGLFDVFCELVTDDELEEILADYDAESEDNEENEEEYAANAQQNYEINKDEHEGLKEETINEVSRKAATSAFAAANDPDSYHRKADAILGHIERKFGYKAARDAETHAYTSHFGRGTPSPGKDSLSGGLRQYLDDKLTKSGKIPKGTQKAMKNRMDPKKWQGYGRKVGGPKKKLPEETINEGRPSQRHPLEGHPYHKKSDAELTYIGKDAHKAAEAMKGHNKEAEAKYLDQANDAATVRYFRKRNGMPNWYKKKYGHDTVKEEKAPFEGPYIERPQKDKFGNKITSAKKQAEKLARKAMKKAAEAKKK